MEIVLEKIPEDKDDKNKVILDLGDGEQKEEGKEKKTGADKASVKDPEQGLEQPKQDTTIALSENKTDEAIISLTKEIVSLKTAVEEKAGRELSTKNRALIKTCVDAMATATEALGVLLAATEPDDDGKQGGYLNPAGEEITTLDLTALLHKEEINLEELGKEICKTIDIPKLITDSIEDNK